MCRLSTRAHGVTTQDTSTLIFTAVCVWRGAITEWNTPRGVTGKHSWYSEWIQSCAVRGSNLGGGNIFLSSRKRPYRLRGPPSIIFSGYRGSSPGLRRLRHEINHSPPFSVEIKNYWGCTVTPPICLHVVDRESFTPVRRLVVLCFVTAFFVLYLSRERFSYALQTWRLRLIHFRLVQTTAEDAGCLTFQYRSRCIARPFNSSHAAGLGAPYGCETFKVTKFKSLTSCVAFGI